MDKKEITERVKGILVDDLFVADSVDEITDTAALGTDLGLDSVGFVELATIVGEVFEIVVTDADVGQGNLANVQILTDFVYGKLQEKSGAKSASPAAPEEGVAAE